MEITKLKAEDAKVVAVKFILEYYASLGGREDSKKIDAYYQEDSICSRGDESKGQKDLITAKGMQSIRPLLQQYSMASGAQISLKTVDSQPAAFGGVILAVLGEITEISNEYTITNVHRFSQTFLLFTVPGTEKLPVPHYYIQNDLFRYLSSDRIVAHINQSKPESPNVSKIDTHQTPEPIKSNISENVQPKNNIEEKPTLPVKIEDNSPITENNAAVPVLTQEATDNDKTKVKSNTKKNPIKKKRDQPNKSESTYNSQPKTTTSWAQVAKPILQENKTVPAHEPPPVTAVPKTTDKNTAQQTEAQDGNGKHKTFSNDRDLSCSLFISNLPAGTKENKIRETILASEGNLEISNITVRNNYAFIEFPSVEMTQRALATLKKGTTEIGGNKLFVEERNHNSNQGKPRGGGMGGRGKRRGRGDRGTNNNKPL